MDDYKKFAEDTLITMFIQAQAQFGSAIKSYWFRPIPENNDPKIAPYKS